MENQPMQTPDADLEKAALEHYEKLATLGHEWLSTIPQAIHFYFSNRRAEPADLRELVEKWRTEAVNYLNTRFAQIGTAKKECADELEAALANTEPSVPASLSQASELKDSGSMNSDTYQPYPDRILRAADEILFQFESYAVNKTPWPALKELAAIIKKWEPFLLTTEGVTLSMERYNELIEKEDKFDHLGCMSISTDGTLIKDYTIKEPSVPVSQWILCSDRLPEAHGEYITYQTGYRPTSAGVQSMYFNPDLEYPWTEEDDSTPVIAWMPKPEPPITEARSHE